jgi:hypothetical protein
MKKIYFLVLALCFFNVLSAQVINFPDANFKARLLSIDRFNSKAKNIFGNWTQIDLNGNGEIEVSEAQNIIYLDLYSSSSLNYIVSLEGILNFTKLQTLICYNNKISSIDLRGLTTLTDLDCNTNEITSLNVSDLINLQEINCNNNKITYLDVSNLTNLKILNCYKNQLTTLNMSGCKEVFNLYCEYNQLTSLDLTTVIKLDRFQCSYNQFDFLDFTNCPDIRYLHCDNNKLKSLNLSNLRRLETLKCDYNFPLTSIFMKNGSRHGGALSFEYCPNLEYICTDETYLSTVETKKKEYGYTKCNVNSYCSFVPGGTFFTINGKNKLDFNNDGCDFLDSNVSHLRYSIKNGTVQGSLISNTSGEYAIPVQAGTHIVTPLLENPDYFIISPASITVTFPGNNVFFEQDFCISLKNPKSDLEIILLPLERASPGFNVEYKIIYKNKGNTIQSGIVNLVFNDDVLDAVFSNPAFSNQLTNNLSWNFANLKPFESREINLTLKVNRPTEIPAVNNGDVLKYKTTIVSEDTDITPLDNVFDLNQTVVGSYDPNDKTCLEGTVITPSLIGEYVHYMIRFENTGTYSAQNIVVKDMIDLSKFDISTLIPTSSNHSFVTKISEGNKVEFIFENINLPFDDATNDGYIAFKIKTKPTLKVGDSFTNDANIYFDYNFPILTNKATSKFQITLDTPDFEFSNYFTLYPNPASDVLNINATQTIEIQSLAIYDILGQLVIAVPNAKSVSNIDVSKLRTGTYFIKVKSDKGSSNMKFIKK